MQIAPLEVDNSFSRGVLDIGVANVPLFRDGPVKYLRAGRDFVQFKRDCMLKQTQTLAKAVPGDASADRIEALDDAVSLPALLLRVDLSKDVAEFFPRSHGAQVLTYAKIGVKLPPKIALGKLPEPGISLILIVVVACPMANCWAVPFAAA